MTTLFRRLAALCLGLALWAAPCLALEIKAGSSTTPVVFLMVLSSDHTSAATGLSPSVAVSKAGGAFASGAGTTAEIANGWYKYTPTSSETGTVGDLILHATAATADPSDRLAEVVAYDVSDGAGLGLSRITASLLVRGSVVSGSTASTVVVGGLPAGANYIGQRLYRGQTGESKAIQAQSYAAPNYTFTLGSVPGTAGPFGSAPSAGEVVGIPN